MVKKKIRGLFQEGLVWTSPGQIWTGLARSGQTLDRSGQVLDNRWTGLAKSGQDRTRPTWDILTNFARFGSRTSAFAKQLMNVASFCLEKSKTTFKDKNDRLRSTIVCLWFPSHLLLLTSIHHKICLHMPTT